MGLMNGTLRLLEFCGMAGGRGWYPGSADQRRMIAAVHARTLPSGSYKARWEMEFTLMTGEWFKIPVGRIPLSTIHWAIVDGMILVRIEGVLETWLLPGDRLHRDLLGPRASGSISGDVTIWLEPNAKRVVSVIVEEY